MFSVKIAVQLPPVDARLALETKLSIRRVLIDELLNFIGAHATFSSNPRQLRLGRDGRDMRVKAASGGGYQMSTRNFSLTSQAPIRAV